MHDGHDDEIPEEGVVVRKRRKGIYILPNLFTLAALFGGFYAVVMAMNGRFDQAAIGVFSAISPSTRRVSCPPTSTSRRWRVSAPSSSSSPAGLATSCSCTRTCCTRPRRTSSSTAG